MDGSGSTRRLFKNAVQRGRSEEVRTSLRVGRSSM